jgi:HPt (histidine-containing phosphotransfer) domain-containing protein
MNAPVDLTNLRSMTDGDAEIEKELFAEFIVSFEEGIDNLRQHCVEEAADTWRQRSHALKGVALNLGAARLGDLCKLAQEEYQDVPKAKEELLRYIEAEFRKVREFLNTVP